MKKINLLRLMLVLMLLLLVTTSLACKKDDNKITVCEVTHSVFYAPLYAAIELGYFEEEGLIIELVNGNGADKVMSALLSKDADIGLMGPEASIYVYQGGQENYAINFAQLTRTDGSFICGRNPDDNFTLDKLKGKSILGGRKGGVPEMTLEYVLKKNGLLVGRDDEKVLGKGGVLIRTDVQFSAMAGAFVSGECDYTTLFEPTATQLVNEKKGYVLASVGEYAKDVPYTAFSALKDYMKENEDKIIAFTKAISKGLEYVNNASSEEIANVIKPHFTSSTINDLIQVTNRHKEIKAWPQTPKFLESSLNNLMDIMIEAGELKEYVDYNKIVTTKYVK